jgi:hypothetical protein
VFWWSYAALGFVYGGLTQSPLGLLFIVPAVVAWLSLLGLLVARLGWSLTRRVLWGRLHGATRFLIWLVLGLPSGHRELRQWVAWGVATLGIAAASASTIVTLSR